MTGVVGARAASIALLLARHPMHTSTAELREESNASVQVAIRLFPDDLDAAVPGAASGGADSALARYVRRGFRLFDRSGRPVELRWKGARRVDDALVLRLDGDLPGGLAGASVAHALLLEQFRDQVNVVRARYGGRTMTLLFMAGDTAKRLP